MSCKHKRRAYVSGFNWFYQYCLRASVNHQGDAIDVGFIYNCDQRSWPGNAEIAYQVQTRFKPFSSIYENEIIPGGFSYVVCEAQRLAEYLFGLIPCLLYLLAKIFTRFQFAAKNAHPHWGKTRLLNHCLTSEKMS